MTRSLAKLVTETVAQTRRLPAWARYAGAAVIVGVFAALRLALDGLLGNRDPFVLPLFAVLLAAGLFDRGSGVFATALGAVFVGVVYLRPFDGPPEEDPGKLLALALFVGCGAALAIVVEAMHRAIADAQRALAELARSETRRRLLLQEFRHRTRNDLQSLSALLLLRARGAPSSSAADGLREAAEHARALARVHSWLAADEAQRDGDPGQVDTRNVILGLCQDLEAAQAGSGLRAVALLIEAEAHLLDAERAIHLGLVLNELVTNAFKYAFPDERHGTIRVHFVRDGETFVLTVADDGVGLEAARAMGGEERAAAPPAAEGGLGTRLLHALAAQLRGAIALRRGAGGVGTTAELRFPCARPGVLREADQG
jgi:two-component sensor histidine kinase